MNWTHTQALHFISLIKERPALWDRSSIDHKSKSKRLEAWEEVAQLMDISVRNAEAKWANLTKQYYREKRRCRERGSNARSRWFAYKAMDSLLSGNIRSLAMNKLWRRDMPRAGWSSGIQHGRTDPLSVVLKEAINTLTVIRQNKIDNTPTYPSDDALKSFGEYITVSLRKFPPQIQSKAKYEINQILYKADMENLGKRVDASSLQEDINESGDVDVAEYINVAEDMNEAEEIHEAEYLTEDMNEAEYLDEVEYLNQAEDANKAEYLDEAEDTNEAEYLNEAEDTNNSEDFSENKNSIEIVICGEENDESP